MWLVELTKWFWIAVGATIPIGIWRGVWVSRRMRREQVEDRKRYRRAVGVAPASLVIDVEYDDAVPMSPTEVGQMWYEWSVQNALEWTERLKQRLVAQGLYS